MSQRAETKYGLGKHFRDLDESTNMAAGLRLFYFGEATYYITVSLTKMSILFLYLKLIPQHGYQIASWVLMVFVALTGLSCTLAGIFQCKPIERAWFIGIEGKCFDQVALFLANAGLNIAQDFLIYFLPLKPLWDLQLPRRQRIALIAIFTVGAFVCVTGIIRLDSLKLASVSSNVTCKLNNSTLVAKCLTRPG